MNWLQRLFKFSSLSNNSIFFFIDGKVIFFPEMHATYLQNKFALNFDEAYAFRFLLPRGRATQMFDESVLIEASPELKPYSGEIARNLGIEPMDRPQWEFDGSHYEISSRYTMEILQRTSGYSSLSPGAKYFLDKYAPHLINERKIAI